MNRSLLLLLPFCWLLMTCKKDDGLPPETQTGANTFGCLVNGKKWIPTGGAGLFSRIEPVYGGLYDIPLNPRVIAIKVRANSPGREGMDIFVRASKVGEYIFNKSTLSINNDSKAENYAAYGDTEGRVYYTNPQATGKVIITKADTITGNVAGTFYFTARNPKGETIEVTKGRFDVKP